MTAQQVKEILKKKYPTGTISNHYFFINGRYYSGITFRQIPKEVKLHFPDRSFLGVSVDANNGTIEDFSSFDICEICKPFEKDVKNW